jgi:hypothetical protein
MTTCRKYRRGTLLSLGGRGLVESQMMARGDGDGGTLGGGEREGWYLTEAGRAAALRLATEGSVP